LKPYYQDDFITLYLGDALENDEWLEADVLITDPPYGQAYKSNFNFLGQRSKWHDKIVGDSTTESRDKVIERWGDERAAIVFGTWKRPRPEKTRQVVVWDKTPCGYLGDLALPFGNAHEEIYLLNRHGWNGKREPSIIRQQMLATLNKNRPDHPTPKPIPLMEKLVSKTTGVVADPFAGSGATLIAAKNLGRKSIGFEISEDYCNVIVNQLETKGLF